MTMLAINYLSGQLMRNIRVNVILPHEEMHADRSAPMPWKTLYLLNGYTGNSDNMLHTLSLERFSARYGIAIVLPDGENSFYMNHPATSNNFENLVAEELVSMTRKLLPLSNKYEDTWIGGISMGGYGALMVGLRHSDVFSKIAAVSPACQVYGPVGNGFPRPMLTDLFQNEEKYLANYDPFELLKQYKLTGRTIPKIFMCCGTEDVVVLRVCREMIEKLRKEDISITYQESNGGHTSGYWNQALPEAMAFLTGSRNG